MRCTHCHNAMNKTAEVTEHHTRQTWFECPLCAAQKTVSAPLEQTAHPVSATPAWMWKYGY